MSYAYCPKCKNSSFEAVPSHVDNLRVPVYFICCKSCNTVVGTSEVHLIDLVKKLVDKLDISY